MVERNASSEDEEGNHIEVVVYDTKGTQIFNTYEKGYETITPYEDGVAYVLDEDGTFSGYCNKEIVLLEQLKEINDTMQLQKMILKHAEYTGSSIARRILADWDSYVKKFVKVIPKDYKRVTEKVAQYLQSGISEQEATIKVFEEVQA